MAGQSMADEEETAMDKEVHLVVQVVVRKGEPLPEDPRPKTPPSESEGAEPEPEAGEAVEEPPAKPTLEELGVKFVLNTFSGETLER